MPKLFSRILIILCVTGTALTAVNALPPVTSGLTHKYGIYFFSEDSTLTDSIHDSYLHFSLKAGIGATYDYYINERQHVEGRVESYNETAQERQYVLERFFDNRHNALLRIIDLPNCDNLKAAVIQYADANADSTGVFLQYILTDNQNGNVRQILTH